MSDRTYAINEIVGTPPQDLNQAIRNGVRISQTVRLPDWFELVDVRGTIADARSRDASGDTMTMGG